MKKFVIIAVVLILLAAGAFGYSMYHYLAVTGVINSAPEPTQAAADTAQPPVPQEPVGETLAVPATGTDSGIFAQNYEKASSYVENLSKEQMVGQLLMGICADASTIATETNRYSLGGMLFESTNFGYSTAEEITQTLATAAGECTVKPIYAAQEEGGSRTTFSGIFPEYTFNTLRSEFESGGLQGVEKAEENKANMLKSLGINLNLAPVVDLAQQGDQIMYSRSISSDVATVSAFAEYAAKFTQAKGVSVALKHFPGYGTLPDSAVSNSEPVVDERAADTIRATDYAPFKAGAEAGAHFIMVSNVVVKGIDAAHTAALSPAIHTELRNNVGFSGVIITAQLDDMDYSAYADGKKPAVQAVLAGNDMILVRDYATAYSDILAAVNDGTIGEQMLKNACTRVIAYKYTAGILQ